MYKVFLGGTCADSTWRDELIPIIEIPFFNPVVEAWTPDCQAREEVAKSAECNIHFYLISQPQSIFSIAEVVDSSKTFGKITILHVMPEKFDKYELKHMKAIAGLVTKNGGIAFVDKDIRRSARVLNNCFSTFMADAE